MTEVTQEDRDVADAYSKHYGRHAQAANVKRGTADNTFHLKLLAAHRIAADRAGYERGQRETVERIVAWIRTGAMFAYTDQEMADAIEAGEWK